jgi:superfamily II DNA or RNA helicase
MSVLQAKIVFINAVWSQVFGLNDFEMDDLKKSLTIRDQYSPRGFKRSKKVRTPGVVRFMSDDGVFLTGLVPEVEMALGRMGFDVVFARKKSCPLPLEIDESLLTPTLVTPRGCPLRDDQMEFLRRYVEYRRGIVKASTGFGKTALIAALLKITPPKALKMVLINSIDLIDQTYEGLIELGIDEKILGVFNGTCKKANLITLTTTDSLPSLVEIIPLVELLIADECHYKSVSSSVVPFLRMFVAATDRVALSATPWKKKDPPHNWKLRGHFGVLLGETKTKDLQEAGILSMARTIFHQVGMDTDDVGAFDEGAYKEDYDTAYRDLVVENDLWHDQVAKLVSGMKGRTLIRVERKAHGMKLMDRIPGAIWVSGDDVKSYRRDVREKLKTSSEDVVVVATRIFNTGVDVYLHNMVNCAGMASDIQTIQGYGRGLRLAPDKDHVDYHDFFHNTHKSLRRHSEERVRTLRKEGHKIEIVDDLG